ncbi:acyl carrier protein [bacterium]|nr:acyl carrier protein [bacterium]
MQPHAALMSVGLDSIAAAELSRVVADQFGVVFSAIVLFDHPTLDSVASYLASQIGDEPEKIFRGTEKITYCKSSN